MADQAILIEAVGGIQSTDGAWELGTDAVAIGAAIEKAWSADGILLLVDMGSAVMSTQLALDLLPAQTKAGCLISNAPLIEGAIVAAIEASMGHSLADVNRAAESACSYTKVERA